MADCIRNVAIIGAGGNVGRYMTEALLKTGKHTVTALTRSNSKSELPKGVQMKEIDYEKLNTVVDGLRGQDALVITLSGHALQVEEILIQAAAEARVPWILPNEWSPDTANEKLVDDVFIFKPKVATRRLIEELGGSSYIAVVTGHWADWNLAMPSAFGIDTSTKTATLFDDGTTKVSLSSRAQVGRAVAALLSLPVQQQHDSKACLEALKNNAVYIKSFTINQKEMLASAIRVTGSTQSDWKVAHESSRERYDAGLEEIKQGKYSGFAKMMYKRMFFPDGSGDFVHGKGTLNKVLQLPEENLDQVMGEAIERAKTTAHWGAQ